MYLNTMLFVFIARQCQSPGRYQSLRVLTPSDGHRTYGRQEGGTHLTGMLSCDIWGSWGKQTHQGTVDSPHVRLGQLFSFLNRRFMGNKSPTQYKPFQSTKELRATSDECLVMLLETGADVNMGNGGFNACGTSRSDNVVHNCVVLMLRVISKGRME